MQISGDKAVSAGSIVLNIVTAQASLTVNDIAQDNRLNGVEQQSDVVLSGKSAALAKDTDLTVTLNGKTYTTKVGADGLWTLNVPAADAKALADGQYSVVVKGIDATGNNITASQTLIVDTKAPTLTVDTLAGDNIINAAEHAEKLVVSGKTDAEPGQTVKFVLNGHTYVA